MGKCRLFARPPSSYIPIFPWFPRRGLSLQGFHQAVGNSPDVVSLSPLLVYSFVVCCGVPALGNLPLPVSVFSRASCCALMWVSSIFFFMSFVQFTAAPFCPSASATPRQTEGGYRVHVIPLVLISVIMAQLAILRLTVPYLGRSHDILTPTSKQYRPGGDIAFENWLPVWPPAATQAGRGLAGQPSGGGGSGPPVPGRCAPCGPWHWPRSVEAWMEWHLLMTSCCATATTAERLCTTAHVTGWSWPPPITRLAYAIRRPAGWRRLGCQAGHGHPPPGSGALC